MQRHQRTLAGESPREGYESHWLRADGSTLDVMIFEAPLVDARGAQIGWMGSVVDITTAKRLEDRERRHTEQMAHHSRLTMLGEIASTLAQPPAAASRISLRPISKQAQTIAPRSRTPAPGRPAIISSGSWRCRGVAKPSNRAAGWSRT